MAFKDEIEAIVGDIDSPSYIAQANLFLVEGVKFITKYVMNNPAMAERMTTSGTALSNDNSLGLGSVLKVVSVTRYDGARDREALEIPAHMVADLSDASSIYANSKLDPKYYISNGNLRIVPAPTASQTATVRRITPDTTVSTTDVSLDSFPDELERGLILYTAKELTRLFINTKSDALPANMTLPTVPSSPVINVVSYADATNADAGATNVATISKATVTNNVPTYVPPTLTLTTAPSISDLTISSSAPTAPNLQTTIIADLGTAPTYTQPSLSINYTQLGATADAYGVDDLIAAEDVELAQVVLSKNAQQIQKYQSDMQNNLNEFQEGVTEYQAGMQRKIEQAGIESGEDNQAIQKYQSETQVYSANVQKEIQQYQSNLEKELQLWTSKRSTELNKYQADMQNSLNSFNEENIRYQAELQAELSEHQADLQSALTNAQAATQVSLSNKQADQALALQNASANMQEAIQDNASKINSYATELQGYSQEVGKEVQNFTTQLQKINTDYQWLQQQYQNVVADLVAFLQQYIPQQEVRRAQNEITSNDRPS